MLKRLKEPTGRVDVADAFVAGTEAQCPRCHWVDKLFEMVVFTQDRGGLKIRHLRCTCCETRWRRIDCE